jgi:hypothetical protein
MRLLCLRFVSIQSQPGLNAVLNRSKLLSWERSQPANQLHRWNCHKVLNVKGAGFEETHVGQNLEPRVANAGRVRNQGVSTLSLLSLVGTLSTKHGRTLATMPKSTNHTSPRLGISAIRFLGIQRLEYVVRQSSQRVVRKGRVGQFARPTQQFDQKLALIFRR